MLEHWPWRGGAWLFDKLAQSQPARQSESEEKFFYFFSRNLLKSLDSKK